MESWDYQLVWSLVQSWLTFNTASKAPRMPLKTIEPQRLYRQIAEPLRSLISKPYLII